MTTNNAQRRDVEIVLDRIQKWFWCLLGMAAGSVVFLTVLFLVIATLGNK